jgi:O-antigen/teichoic acid export membrane protein
MGNPRDRWIARLPTVARTGLLSVGWTSLAQFVGMAIRLASNLILTRLLAPGDYGILGAAMAVITTLEWLSDLGILPSLVRHPDGDRPEFLLTGWWMALSRGLLLFGLGIGLAWPMSLWYDAPQLLPVLAALALRPVILALHSPGMPLLRRRLDYRALFLDEVGQTVAGTVVSLILAWYWRSVWAIVAGTLAGAVAGVFLSYALCPLRPRFTWNQTASREIGHLGKQVFANTLVMALWLNFGLLIGLRFIPSETERGFYVVALNLAGVLETLLSRACDVYFSLLTRLASPDAQRAWHRKICNRAVWWVMPVLAAGVLLGPIAIRILYDPRYAPAGILFALLVARLLVRGLGQLQFQYLLARAEVGPATRAYILALIVQAAIMLPLVWTLGATGLALATLVSTAVVTFAQSLSLRRAGAGSLTPFTITMGWTGLALLPLWLFS